MCCEHHLLFGAGAFHHALYYCPSFFECQASGAGRVMWSFERPMSSLLESLVEFWYANVYHPIDVIPAPIFFVAYRAHRPQRVAGKALSETGVLPRGTDPVLGEPINSTLSFPAACNCLLGFRHDALRIWDDPAGRVALSTLKRN